jgi:SAM-dependent methyltransferase
MASTNDHPSSAAWQKSNIAQKYLNAENATRLYASILVSKSNLANITSEDETHVLDLACGTGATVQEIYDVVPKDKWNGLKVHGGDVSQPMLDYLAGRGRENGWSGLSTGVVDGNVRISFPPSIPSFFRCGVNDANVGCSMIRKWSLATRRSRMRSVRSGYSSYPTASLRCIA